MNNLSFSQQITFLHAQNLQTTQHFYSEILSLPLVRDQETCLIFRVTGSAFLGFCTHIESTEPGRKVILTLVTDDVDEWYRIIQNRGAELMAPPKANPKYQIYHFFLKDPDGYWVEIQRFNHPL